MNNPVWERIREIVGSERLDELKKRQKELHDMIDWSAVDPEYRSDIENHYNLINWDALKTVVGVEKYKELEKKFLNLTLTNTEYDLVSRYTYSSLLPKARFSQNTEYFNENTNSVGTESVNNSNTFGNMTNGGRRKNKKSRKSKKSRKYRKTNRRNAK